MDNLNIYHYQSKWKDNDHITLLAVLNGKPVGTVMVQYGGRNKHQALIWNLHVVKEHRKKRIGEQLLKLAIGDAAARGLEKVYLEWGAYDSPGWVFDWYKRAGFKPDCVAGAYERRNVVQMTFTIKQ